MTTHIVCRDCDAENLLDDDDLAEWLAEKHAAAFDHDVRIGRVDG